MNHSIKISCFLLISLIFLSYSNSVSSSGFDKDWGHFIASKEASDKATEISNYGEPISYVSKETVEEIIRLKKIALSEAQMVSDRFLKKSHRSMLKYYRNYYQKSLELYIYGLENNDLEAILNYHILHSEFIDWFNANKNKFKSP